MLEIQGDTSFACIRIQENMPHAGVVHRPDMAHVVAFWGFHLDDLCAQLGKDLCCKRSHHHGGEIENFDARQRTGGARRRSSVHVYSGIIPACLMSALQCVS